MATTFGTYSEINGAPGKTHEQIFHEVIQLAKHADQAGFDVFTALEHPFFERFSVNTNPLALFCSLAPLTRNLRFRTLCHTLPLHKPMILAGEIAEADVLLYGRLDVGLGRGHAWLCDPANVAPEESQERFLESVEILRRAWSNETFSFAGKYYTCDNLSVVPRPVQKPHPPIYVVGSSDKQFKMAADNGWGVVAGAPAPWKPFVPQARTYLEACTAAGTRPKLGFMKAIYVAETDEIAHGEARRHLESYMQYVFSPLDSLPKDEAGRDRLRRAGYGFYLSDDLAALRTLPYEALVDVGVAVIGSPDTVTEGLKAIQAEIPFDELLVVTYFGDIPLDKAIKSQDLFARHVMPRLRTGTAAAAE